MNERPDPPADLQEAGATIYTHLISTSATPERSLLVHALARLADQLAAQTIPNPDTVNTYIAVRSHISNRHDGVC